MRRHRHVILGGMHRSALFGALEQDLADTHEYVRLAPHLAVDLVIAPVIVRNSPEYLAHKALEHGHVLSWHREVLDAL